AYSPRNARFRVSIIAATPSTCPCCARRTRPRSTGGGCHDSGASLLRLAARAAPGSPGRLLPSLSGANMLDEEERAVAGERRHRGREGARTDLLRGRPSPVRRRDPVTVVREVLLSIWPTRPPPRAPASGWRRPRQRPQGPRPAARAYDGPLRSGVAHTAPVTRPLPRGRPGSSS